MAAAPRAACDGGVPLVFDESGCGFLLGRGGAQAHFDVVADAVCYGKALGGGLPLGALCGPAWLLQNSEPHLPLRAAVGVSGGDGVLGHPALMVRTNAVLRQLDALLPPPPSPSARRRWRRGRRR